MTLWLANYTYFLDCNNILLATFSVLWTELNAAHRLKAHKKKQKKEDWNFFWKQLYLSSFESQQICTIKIH